MPVKVGSLGIDFSIDTTTLMRGISIARSGLGRISAAGTSVQADLTRIATITDDVSKKFTLFGLGAAGIMIALAKDAPAVAPAMARIDVTMMKLSHTLGRALAPSFERLAVHLANFGEWVADHETEISNVATAFFDVGESIANILLPPLEGLATWAGENPELFANIATGIGAIAVSTKVLGAAGGLAGLGTLAKGVGGLAGSVATLGAGAAVGFGGVAAMRAIGIDQWLEGIGAGIAANVPGAAGIGTYLANNQIVQGAMGAGKVAFEDIPDWLLGLMGSNDQKMTRRSTQLALQDNITG